MLHQVRRQIAILVIGILIICGAVPLSQAVDKSRNPIWKEVEGLIDQQQFAAANGKAARILAQARAEKNSELITEAIIKSVQLQLGQHSHEAAVRFLMQEPWPKEALYQNILRLYYANVLAQYQQMYSYEITQREKTNSAKKQDLKSWTTFQIAEEIRAQFDAVLANEAALKSPPPEFYKQYIVKNNFPANVRPTMRDVVVYMATVNLADTSFWRPEESNEVYRLNLKSLLDPRDASLPKLANPAMHPLAKISALLATHRAFHEAAGRPEAALEARYEIIRTFHSAVERTEDRRLIEATLLQIQSVVKKTEWWAVGQSLLAQIMQNSERPGKFIDAHKAASEGLKVAPNSVGGKMCAQIVKSIEMPSYRLEIMSADGNGKPSLVVTAKNLAKLYFRAYQVDLESRLRDVSGPNLALDPQHIANLLLSKQQPVATWSVDLPQAGDYLDHRTFVTPETKNLGAYAIVASSQANFSDKAGETHAVAFLVTQIVLQVSNGSDAIETRVYDGESGQPLKGASVELYRYSWSKPSSVVKTLTTDAQGYARFDKSSFPQNTEGGFFAIARNGKSWATEESVWLSSAPRETAMAGAFIYTDRSVYRPEQTIQWKVTLFKGEASVGKYQIDAGATTEVRLFDLNGKIVDRREVKSNEYGSASGEFRIPTGRPLGRWRLQAFAKNTRMQAQATHVLVEEYKRPTFEVTIKDSKEDLRLNRPAQLTGEARTYFGEAVSDGKVKWRVTRQPVWLFASQFWWWPRPQVQPQLIASGESTVSADGTFAIKFTPQADEREKNTRGISYDFRVEADITDSGGETRQGSKSIRLGFVAVAARIDMPSGYVLANKAIKFDVVLTDLNGQPRKGEGGYRLVRVVQPEKTFLPAEMPRSISPDPETGDLVKENKFTLPSDRRRGRWETEWSWQALVASWKDGEAVSQGRTKHGENGVAKVEIPKGVPAGVYRLVYETKDAFGATQTASSDFIVGGSSALGVRLPLFFALEKSTVEVGDVARFMVQSGLEKQNFNIDIYRGSQLLKREVFESGGPRSIFELPIKAEDRRGLSVVVTGLRDYQTLRAEAQITVPWTDKKLDVKFSSFRDRVRPGGKETFRVTVKGENAKATNIGAAEVLAYMYDRSLDFFLPHAPFNPQTLYPTYFFTPNFALSIGMTGSYSIAGRWPDIPASTSLSDDRLYFEGGYGIGGPGRVAGYGRRAEMYAEEGANEGLALDMAASAPPGAAPMAKSARMESANLSMVKEKPSTQSAKPPEETAQSPAPAADPTRVSFQETAFWKPHLITDRDGSVSFEFTVPDSLTSWNVWVHAISKDLRYGSVSKTTQSVKELMVRPYVPRFLREGDKAEIRVTVNNASEAEQKGELTFDIQDPATGKSLAAEFALDPKKLKVPFRAGAHGSATLKFNLNAPKRIGVYAIRVEAKTGKFSDGERRPFPVLPSRLHLAQSRFAALKPGQTKTLSFQEMTAADKGSEKLVVTIDAQLFYGVLQALPYIIEYPYACTEQLLNKFLASGIISSVFEKNPAVAKMAKEMSSRKTVYERFDQADANRRMALEETPYLPLAEGGRPPGEEGREEDRVLRILDRRVAQSVRDRAIAELRKAQLPTGAFPWFKGGPPDPFMTIYILSGLSHAAEFKVDVPKEMTVKGWRYLRKYYDDELRKLLKGDCCWETVTFLNYVLGSYHDPSWIGGAFTATERSEMLGFSFKNWKKHTPYLKGMLAQTLMRANRKADADLVWNSVMDSAKTNEDLGTYWAPEDRSWLWMNDTIETHAFALRTLMELNPKDKRNDGLVQWLFLNKKLNHWKSTRATAEVIYSLLHFLEKNDGLGKPESVSVKLGPQLTKLDFDPIKYTGNKNQIVVVGDKVDPTTMSKIEVAKTGPGLAFASATWHFVTDILPKEDQGDFFNVSRRYFKREQKGKEWTLTPLVEGASIDIGDQIEVQLSLRTKHAAEYVHLRDPRAAGLEPENQISGNKWDLGISWYEETRDSGANFFFARLPVGEYNFKYRLRANMAGTFRIGPAEVQSVYAPEFNAYSAGNTLLVK